MVSPDLAGGHSQASVGENVSIPEMVSFCEKKVSKGKERKWDCGRKCEQDSKRAMQEGRGLTQPSAEDRKNFRQARESTNVRA
jgi:hypothetical protein